jgi:hypothetical protein
MQAIIDGVANLHLARMDQVVRRFTLFHMRTRKILSGTLAMILFGHRSLLSLHPFPHRARPIARVVNPNQKLEMLHYQHGRWLVRKDHPRPIRD